ncbi:hypothetical protein BZA05DRAFT_344787 [Tricharina praecox]|uniref:uncharacterized protein n=1 Tax=Tricharina praecox TaxID=43433 RepID=UPI00222047E0|nr:uncharacterized protein BZA05DRAFT_344787 [Tricharina praecox]KAI5841723.1 hypothetical protein BZA05DRAFT_344787 [Tricharina praecox]
MAPRRSHTKSRTGCQRCRKRRIKCDETRPSCGNCTKHAVACDFALITGNTVHDLLFHDIDGKESRNQALSSRSPVMRLSSPSFAISESQLIPPSFSQFGIPTTDLKNLNPVDLSLMHHWTIATWSTVSNRAAIQQLWRINIPALAVRHPFLMSAVLAVSAMHLHTKDRDRSARTRYLSSASQHLSRAVRGLSGSLAHLSETNCDAVFATASLIAIFSFSASHTSPRRLGGHSRPVYTAWVPLFRGVSCILRQDEACVRSGPLSPMLQHSAAHTCTATAASAERLDPATELVFQRLFQLCTDRTLPDGEEIADTEVATAYFNAIADLRRSFATIHLWDSVVSAVFRWPTSVAARFVELLEQRRPRALVIFVHYCTLLSLLEEFWWVRGSALFELTRWEEYLSEEWSPWLEWPRLIIRAGGVGIAVAGGERGGGYSPCSTVEL